MSDETTPPAEEQPAPPTSLAPTIRVAELASGPSGTVEAGAVLDFSAAVARRQASEDMVVCGENADENRRLASRIEAAVGPASRPQFPHRRAGPRALPHFHQATRSPDGHT